MERADPPTPLPAGPWTASLRELGTSLGVLACSTEVLSTATQLTRLALTDGGLDSNKDQVAFWQWAHSHPSLRHLQIESSRTSTISGAKLSDFCSLACRRRDVEVSTRLYDWGHLFDDEFTL